MKKPMIAVIEKNRNLFISYNISRLRELIRYLPEEKFDLFQTIPFLLSVNTPDYPGFVDVGETGSGIYNFDHSGFYKYALKKFDLQPEEARRLMPTQPAIYGLYLMGSAGTLTQSDKSDFDYWVVVDHEKISQSGLNQLTEKVKRLEKWSFEEYQQEVTFFIMDVQKIKANEFSAVGGESSGSAQRTLLKEEFYRTFIMLAGKIPFWAVLPLKLSDDEYKTLVDPKKGETDYLDTGNLVFIDPDECLGAVLWQVYKARNDPVKALIKASLIAYYFFNASEEESAVCNILKEKFSDAKIEDPHFDPYTIVFEKIIQFYMEIDDVAGLGLIRKCILLRLLGYPFTSLPDLSSPKGQLLLQYAEAWKFDLDLLTGFKKFHTWPEAEKLDFENGLFDKISFLYELILRSSDDLVKINMTEDDLGSLVNRTAAFRQKIEGKIAFASIFLRKKSRDLFFTLKEGVQKDGSSNWTIYGETIESPSMQPVYGSDNFLESVGWLVLNRFVKADYSNIKIEMIDTMSDFANPVESFRSVSDFFNGFFPRPEQVYKTQRASEGILFFLKAEKSTGQGRFIAADYLLLNSWGELYVNRLDFSPLESMAQKCYKIAIIILNLIRERDGYDCKYLICCSGKIEGQNIPDVVSLLIGKILECDEVSDSEAINTASTKFFSKKNKPFLDII